MIVRGTTPTIRFTFSTIDTADIDVAYFTITQNEITIVEHDLTEATVGVGYLEWTLTQEETLAMSALSDIVEQCRYRMKDDSAYASLQNIERPYDVNKNGVI